jgi:hypothetical protein
MLRLIDQIVARDAKMNCRSKPQVSIDIFAVGAAVESKYKFFNVQIKDLNAVMKYDKVECCGT